MKNSSAIILTIIILSLLGVGAYIYINQMMKSTTDSSLMKADESTIDTESVMMQDTTETPNAQMKENTPQEQDEVMMKDETSLMESDARYVTFTPTAFSEASNTRRVLFFYANWCPTCAPADKDFDENASTIPTDVTVIRVNYNDTDTDQAEKDLAKKYGVTYQHTFVQIDAQGTVVTKWNGGQTGELLKNLI